MFAHGRLPFSEAIRRSCNTYFFHTGLALEHRSQRSDLPEGPHSAEMRRLGGLGYWGKKFGFGRHTGIDLPSERRGLMPDRVWLSKRPRSRGGGPWTDGITCNTAIGQGYVTVTPLQAAVAMAAIANGGTIVRPHVVQELEPRSITGEDGSAQSYARWRLPLAPGSKTLAHVRRAMVEVVNNQGTGRRAMLNHVVVAGKTGSAENSRGRTHAWFCGFAPAGDPTVAFAVILENAGHGGAEAAPVARKVLEALFPDETGPAAKEGRG
jgi:penicillin-binding protein 2